MANILYYCPGSCKGVIDQPVSCGAEDCELHNVPLKAFEQCEGCSIAAEADGQFHHCDNCTDL